VLEIPKFPQVETGKQTNSKTDTSTVSGISKVPQVETGKQANSKTDTSAKPISKNSEISTQHYIKAPEQKNQKEIKEFKRLTDSETVNLDLDRLEVRAEQVTHSKKEAFNLMSTADKTQTELIQRAFSHDDVEAEFEHEKNKIIEDQLPKDDLDLDLPGWGSWGGSGNVGLCFYVPQIYLIQ